MSAPRPMRTDDALGVHLSPSVPSRSSASACTSLPEPPPRPEPALIRINQLLDRDPGGAWVTERDGELVGAALAIDRDGLWGLSLLVVHPEHQSAGLGRELLAPGARVRRRRPPRRGHPRLARRPRAAGLRARAGFAAHPSFRAARAARAASSGPGACATATRATSA